MNAEYDAEISISDAAWDDTHGLTSGRNGRINLFKSITRADYLMMILNDRV